MYRWIATCFAALAAAAALAAPVRAQETGAVRGTVTLEENGDPVHGAVVLVVGTGGFALTDEQGAFTLENVPAGSWEVLAQRENLTTGRRMVTVEAGETAEVDFVVGLSPIRPVRENAAASASPVPRRRQAQVS